MNYRKFFLLIVSLIFFSQILSMGDGFISKPKSRTLIKDSFSHLIDSETEAYVRHNHPKEEAEVILKHMTNYLIQKKIDSEMQDLLKQSSDKALQINSKATSSVIPLHVENFVRKSHNPEEAARILHVMENYLLSKDHASISIWQTMLDLCGDRMQTEKITDLISTHEQLSLCGHAVSVANGFSQEMVKALHKIAARELPAQQIDSQSLTTSILQNQEKTDQKIITDSKNDSIIQPSLQEEKVNQQKIATAQKVAKDSFQQLPQLPLAKNKARPISLNIQKQQKNLSLYAMAQTLSKNNRGILINKNIINQLYERTKAQSQKESHQHPLISPAVIAAVTTTINALSEQEVQNPEAVVNEARSFINITEELSEEDQLIIFKTLEELYTADDLAKEFCQQNNAFDNFYYLDALQQQVHNEIGLKQVFNKFNKPESMLSKEEKELKRLLEEEKKEFEDCAQHIKNNSSNNNLNNLHTQFLNHHTTALENQKNDYQYRPVNSIVHRSNHIVQSLCNPELRHIPDDFTTYETLEHDALVKYSFINPNIFDPQAEKSPLQQMLGQNSDKHFVLAQTAAIQKEANKINEDFKKYLSKLTTTCNEHINIFAVHLLPKLHSDEKTDLYNNLLRARDFQKNEVLPAIESHLSTLKSQIPFWQASTGDLSHDLFKAYKIAYLKKCIAIAEMQLWQARKYIAYYEECAKITLYDIKRRQRTVQKVVKAGTLGVTALVGYISGLSAEGNRRQREVEKYHEKKNEFEANSRHFSSSANKTSYASSLASLYNQQSVHNPEQLIKVHIVGMGQPPETQQYHLHDISYAPQSALQIPQEYATPIDHAYQQVHTRIDTYVKTGHSSLMDGLDKEALEFTLRMRELYAQAQRDNDVQAQECLDSLLRAYIDFARGFTDEIVHRGIDAIKNYPTDAAISGLIGSALQKASANITLPLTLALNSSVAIKHIDDFIQDFATLTHAIEQGQNYEAGRASAQALADVAGFITSVCDATQAYKNFKNDYFASSKKIAELDHLKSHLAKQRNQKSPNNNVSDTKCISAKREVVLPKVQTYEQARNKALEIIGDVDWNSGKPHLGKQDICKDKIVGMSWYGKDVIIRLDNDPIKGAHINVTDYRTGKGNNGTSICIPFEGDVKSVKAILKHLNTRANLEMAKSVYEKTGDIKDLAIINEKLSKFN